MPLQYNSSGDFIGLSGWQTPMPAPQRPTSTPTAAPQMTPPMAANNSSDLTRSIIGGTPPMPTPDPNMIAGNNIPKAYGGGTPSYQGTNNVIPVPSAYPMVNWTPQLSTEQAAARVAEQKARDQQTSWSNGMANNSMNQQFQPTPAPVAAAPAIPQRTEQYYTDYVNKQIAASLGVTRSAADQAISAGKTAANQQLGSIQSQYDKQQANQTEDRNLQNVRDARIYSPYAGNDQGNVSLRDFARARTDRESSQALTTNQNNVNQNLNDLTNSIEAKQKALVDASPAEAEKLKMSLMNDERNYDLNLRAADERAAQDDFNRQSDTFKNNLAVRGQDLQQQQFNQTQSNADRTYNAGRQDAAANATGYFNPSGMTSNQINQEIAKNSAAWANASPEQKQQLHERNGYLNSLIGKTDTTGSGDYSGGNPNGAVGYATVDKQKLDSTQQQAIIKQSSDIADSLTKMFGKLVTPERNPMMMYAQVAGLSTLDAQKIAADAQNTTFDQAIKKALAANTITQTQASIITQAQNANSSSLNASTSAANGVANRANLESDNTRADSAAASKTYQDTFDNLKSLYTAKDRYTGVTTVTDPASLRASIVAKGFDDAVTIRMLKDFGLSKDPIKPQGG